MRRVFIIIVLVIVVVPLSAQLNQQLSPPDLKPTIEVHPSPTVNENLVTKEKGTNETSSSTLTRGNEPPAQSQPQQETVPASQPKEEPENSTGRKGSNVVLWLIIVGLAGIILGRQFKK
ncbi:MAG TPA: hypothetical protein VHM26_04615 [Chitinophagaceae bacterium]|jgi:hypothetical protein|nr:hypothetical protein [Chitinophagaceae bacterium]